MRRTFVLFLTIILLFAVFAPVIPVQAATASSQAGRVTLREGYLNVRASAATSSKVVSTLNNGSYITLISKTGSWWKVEYGKDRYGYCHADYITLVQSTPVTVSTRSGSLNVRKGAGTSYSVSGGLYKGETVLRLSTANGWSKILYQGTKTGYASDSYLSGTASTGNTAVALSVPSFKQTDSRWANVTIGTSGKTIAQIGCATTAIAMMESYRTGTTIYPDAMSQKLRYTATGSVYWPTDYTAVTDSSTYLSKLYTYLQQGKPILLGAKNSYGGQHWVVVTGFTGGSLVAENFTVNDPGSNTRTTLQQFFNAYSNFYKYFVY